MTGAPTLALRQDGWRVLLLHGTVCGGLWMASSPPACAQTQPTASVQRTLPVEPVQRVRVEGQPFVVVSGSCVCAVDMLWAPVVALSAPDQR
jgi:hypothetical protein